MAFGINLASARKILCLLLLPTFLLLSSGHSQEVKSLRALVRERAPEKAAEGLTLSRARPDPAKEQQQEIEIGFAAPKDRTRRNTVIFRKDGEVYAHGTVFSSSGSVAVKASLFGTVSSGTLLTGDFDGQAITYRVVNASGSDDLLILSPGTPQTHRALVGSQLLAAEDPQAVVGAMVTCGDHIGILSVGRRSVARLEDTPRQERIGNFHKVMNVRVSRRRSGFPTVIEMDLPILPEDCGRPVVDLNGDLIGIAIARATLNASYILPLTEINRVVEDR